MKRFYLFSIAILALHLQGLAENNGIPSKIKGVTIYLKGARVERTATASLVPGDNEIVFEGLSNYIDENSIEVQGQGNATILSVNYRVNYQKLQQESDRVKRFKSSMDSVNLKLEYVKNEISTDDQEIKLLQANYKLGVNPKTDFVEDVEEWGEHYHKKVLEIKNALTKLNIERKELKTLSDQFQADINQENAAVKQPSGEIVVKVQGTGYTNADFRFSYYVANAGWTPLYSLRAENTKDPLKLDYDALVTQQTGEQWKDVKLALSTGNPLQKGNKPELNPWYLNVDEYNDRQLRKSGPLYHKSSQFDGEDADLSYKVDKNDTTRLSGGRAEGTVYYLDGIKVLGNASNYTTSTQNQLNVSFDINLRYTINPDGTPQQVRIQQTTLPAIFEYASAPKLDDNAFLLAKVTGWEDANLLPGTANLYYEGAYIGKSYLDPSVTNDTLNLSFGRDKKINIERKLLRDFSKKQFLGKYKTQNFVYETSVKNTKNIPVVITIEDQIPISQTKEIEVTVKDNSKADYDLKTGKLQWKMTLQPNETKKVKLDFSVRYPKNKYISGL